jgi:hypothetical protein
MKLYRRLEQVSSNAFFSRKGFLFAEKRDQATSDGFTPNPKATEPDDVLIKRATRRNHQREERLWANLL